jgi:hypothetical protein
MKAQKGAEVYVYSFCNLGARGGGWPMLRASRSTPLKEITYPFYRRLRETQDRSERVRKISPPQGFDLRTEHPVASRYTD